MVMTELYKAINSALQIDRADRKTLMGRYGCVSTGATMDGYGRDPKDHRYRPMAPPVLAKYCQAILDTRPPTNADPAAALQRIIDIVDDGGWLPDDIMLAFTRSPTQTQTTEPNHDQNPV